MFFRLSKDSSTDPFMPGDSPFERVALALPEVVDYLDAGDLRRLGRSSRTLSAIADQSVVWRRLFAGAIGVSARDLPEIGHPQGIRPKSVPPYKDFLRGLTLIKSEHAVSDVNTSEDILSEAHSAATRRNPNSSAALDRYCIIRVVDFLDAWLPEYIEVLGERNQYNGNARRTVHELKVLRNRCGAQAAAASGASGGSLCVSIKMASLVLKPSCFGLGKAGVAKMAAIKAVQVGATVCSVSCVAGAALLAAALGRAAYNAHCLAAMEQTLRNFEMDRFEIQLKAAALRGQRAQSHDTIADGRGTFISIGGLINQECTNDRC